MDARDKTIPFNPEYILLYMPEAMEILNIHNKPSFYRVIRKHEIAPVYLTSRPQYKLADLYKMIDASQRQQSR